MNRPLTLESLRLLASQRRPPCVSLYMPTHRHHMGQSEDRLRFKQLLGQAARLLAESLGEGPARARLEPLERLSSDEFWSHQLDGLALFADGNGTLDVSEFRLSASVPELAVVAESFHLRPLLRQLQTSGRYFLLRLSQNHVELLAGDQSGLAHVDVPGLPRTLEDAIGEVVSEGHVNVRSNPGAGRGAIYHGHGTGKEPPPEDMLRYFRAVDAALWSELREQKEPLVLATAKHYHTPYRSVCRYPHLLEQGLQGNFERARPDELHQQAWPLVAPRVEARLAHVLDVYGSWIKSGRATDELTDLGRHAVQGRVLDLLVADGVHLWGRFDRSSGEIALHDKQSSAVDDDVLDDLAEAVLLRGGDVFAVPPGHMPTRSPVAAILRW